VTSPGELKKRMTRSSAFFIGA